MKSRKVGLDEFAHVSKASAFRDDDSSVGEIVRRKGDLNEDGRSRAIIGIMRSGAPKQLNGALAAMFDEMADLQQQSPLENMDEWRSYTYTLVAGRLRHLEFEVTPNADILGSVCGIRGFGRGVMTKIKQFLATGSCDKLKALRTDPARVAIRELTNIWGVGPKTASSLVNRGYRCIADVRRGLASGDVDLSENARVGVDCYEDFLERMQRSEVKLIGDIVAAAVYRIFPEAEVSTMGSYRRGKPQSGDADILIVHPGFVSSTPKNSLARILQLLERDGHIANHLTTVKGASDGTLSNDSQLSTHFDSQNDQEQLSVDDEYRASTARHSLTLSDDHPGSVSWMGVFRSPVHGAKRRRVDIKFYPYREKAFVSLPWDLFLLCAF
jgi:DNA polymerase/3'-5' exonuclease PolX